MNKAQLIEFLRLTAEAGVIISSNGRNGIHAEEILRNLRTAQAYAMALVNLDSREYMNLTTGLMVEAPAGYPRRQET